MDNVLIDDRRIHVDFSQSVSKLWNQYRHGKGGQHPKGGCFKCGNTDHVARDCQQGSNSKQQGPKYVLRNDQTQHGGDGHKRYDMVFDEDLEDKKIRYHDKSRVDERADDRAHRDHRRSSGSSHRQKDERDHKRSESDRYRREDYHERKRRDRDDDVYIGRKRRDRDDDMDRERKRRDRDDDMYRERKHRDEHRR